MPLRHRAACASAAGSGPSSASSVRSARTGLAAFARTSGPVVQQIPEPVLSVRAWLGEAGVFAGLRDGLAGDAGDACEEPEGHPHLGVERCLDRLAPVF